MKRILTVLIVIMLALSLFSCGRRDTTGTDEEMSKLELVTWNDEARVAVNDLIKKYGLAAKEHDKNEYAVLPLDALTILDAGDQMLLYQLEKMAFAESMDEYGIKAALSTGLDDVNSKRGKTYSKKNATYAGWISDIVNAYGKLFDEFGPFEPSGADDDVLKDIHKQDSWKDFSSKMLALTKVVRESESRETADMWELARFTGLTDDELYALAKASNEEYMDSASKIETYTYNNKSSNTGKVSVNWTTGVSVPDNIKELFSVLKDNEIKVWVVTSAPACVARAVIDTWELSGDTEGIIGMDIPVDAGLSETEEESGDAISEDAEPSETEEESGDAISKETEPGDGASQNSEVTKADASVDAVENTGHEGSEDSEYDDENSPKDHESAKEAGTEHDENAKASVLIYNNGSWSKEKSVIGIAEGENVKTKAVDEYLVPKYGRAHIFGAMNASDDFELATLYKDLSLVLVLNTAEEGVTGGSGLGALMSVYQADEQGLDLNKTDKTGDTLYVLQGMDENDLRSYVNSRATMKLGESEETLYCYPDKMDEELMSMKKNKMATKEIVDTFAIRTYAGDASNVLGFTYGFMEAGVFGGYHSVS